MLTDILRLSDDELDRLADALRQGTIRPGVGVQQARNVGLGQNAARVIEWLPGAIHEFGSMEGVIAAIQLIREERRRRSASSSGPELILTGPAFEGVSIRDTRVVVRELFASARRTVLIVGYAFYAGDSIFEPLAERMACRPEMRVRLVVNVQRRGGRTASQAVEDFARDFWQSSWPFHPRPEVFYAHETSAGQRAALARVHAKLVVVDARVVYVSSANFTRPAFHRNLEAGIRVSDQEVGRRLTAYFDRLIEAGYVRPLENS